MDRPNDQLSSSAAAVGVPNTFASAGNCWI
jgi:hypothetical protein